MSKRITKAQLLEQVAYLETQSAIETARLEDKEKDLRASKRKVERLEMIANVYVEHLPQADEHQITMRVDRHAWHQGGNRVMQDVILRMFSQMNREFAADALPELGGVVEDADIQKFLAEWMLITVDYTLRCYPHHRPLSMEFSREVVRRFIGAVVALKEAGKDNYKVRDTLIRYAYEHPIPN